MPTKTVLKPKVSIIGCGNVGMRYAYALIIKGAARSIVVIDRDTKRLEGEVMDLSHGAPFSAPIDIIAGNYPDIKGSDLVVITAGKRQSQGQTRLDLIKDNVAIFKDMVPKIVKYAPKAIILVVTNPVDVLSYAAYKFSGKPAKEVIGSGTVLDTARLRFLLARHCRIDTRNVHAYILGEHGDTEFPVWSNAMIGGVFFKNYCDICGNAGRCDHNAELDKIFTEVRDSAYKIIEKKGETSYGIGLSLVRITQAILRDENAVLPVSSLLDGYLGQRGLYLSLPSVINKTGVREQLALKLSAQEKQKFKRSASQIKGVIKKIGL